MMPRTATINAEIGTVNQKAPVPTASSVKRMASVAYATDDRLSLEKTASALTFESRSLDSSAFESGRPKASRRARASVSPMEPVGSIAAGLATMTPSPTVRKYGETGGRTRTRRSAGRRPTFPGSMEDLDQDGPKIRRVVGPEPSTRKSTPADWAWASAYGAIRSAEAMLLSRTGTA